MDEVAKLLQLVREGQSLEEMADALGREKEWVEMVVNSDAFAFRLARESSRNED
jgi:hypothetical protein